MIGSTISHYKIVAKLGEGGMGVVYKAEDTTLERTVALKFLAAHLLNDEEAKAAAALDHANICTVHEIAEVDGKTFLAIAFLKGETLEERIAQEPLSLKDALDIARQVADGLEAAHEAAIVHRDIRPANIMVEAKGRVTIMDFGLARLTEASRLTKLDTAMGTVAYMSPEQAQGMTVDSRSDLWSLGCVLYEMVSGQRPFQGQYDQALLYKIVHEEPAALTGLRTGVPVELELLGSKCLAKDREDRFQSAKEIMVDLRTLSEKLKSGHSTVLRTTNAEAATPSTPEADRPRDSSKPWLWPAVAGCSRSLCRFLPFVQNPEQHPFTFLSHSLLGKRSPVARPFPTIA
jgi:serine/threonine protein kinase